MDMTFFETVGQLLSEAAQTLGEKTRRIAAENRLRSTISDEERAALREYLALGRYYYNNLRETGDDAAREHCARLDDILARQDQALKTLGELQQFEGPTEAFFARDGEREEVDLRDVREVPAQPEQEEPAPEEPVKTEPAPEEPVKTEPAPAEAAEEPVEKAPEPPKEKPAKKTEKAAKQTAAQAEEDARKAAREVEQALQEAEAPVYSKIRPEKSEADENDDLPFEG